MKKIKGLVLSVLALGCLAMASCTPKGDDKYTVTLMYNGEVISTTEKNKATHLDAPAAPAKEGYTFVGWYVDAELTVPYTPDLLSANLTLYAKYEANTLYVTFHLNGGTLTETKVAVKNGEAYTLPTPTKEGYTFAGWTLDGEAFPASGTYTRTGSVRVSASWTLNKYTVTFTDGTDVLDTVPNVEHGSKVQAWNEPAPGYEVVGIYTDAQMTTAYDFDTPVTGALTLYVKIQAKTFNIIVNDGGTQSNTTAVYGGAYELDLAPTQEGYFFKHYELLDGTNFPASGTYTWTRDIIVNARWDKDPAWGKSTVSFYDGEVEISSLKKVVDDGSALSGLAEAPAKAGHTFGGWYTDKNLTTAFVDGMAVNDDIKIYAKYTANTYTLYVDLNGGTINEQNTYSVQVVYGTAYALPTPVRNGYKFEGYKYNGNAFAASGAYTYAENVTVTVVWKDLAADNDEDGDDTFLVNKEVGYFKEREVAGKGNPFTYVFLTGVAYEFNSFESLEIRDVDAGALTQSGTSFVANKAESGFTLVITKMVDGTSITYTRSAKIVDQVTTFDGGASYNTVWGAGEAKRATNFRNAKVGTAMAVGKDNFKPDLALGSLTQAQAYMQVTAKVDGAETTAFTYNNVNGVINFDNSLIGKTVQLTFAPKYLLPKENFDQDIVMKVLVNDGVNVYTNDEMRTYYGSAAVRTINLLRNIKAEIPKTYGEGGYYMDDTYTIPQNTYDHGVYTRRVSNVSDSIVVNGNFFKIDGSDLPLGDNRVDGREPQGSLSTYYVQNMQIGLFLYYYTMNDSCSHLGQATFNDLFLSANYTNTADWSEKDGDVTVLKSSGTYHGIVLRGGTARVNNTTITNTNIALFNGSEGGNFNVVGGEHVAPSQWILNEAKLYHSWSNQVYMYGFTKLDITNSYLGDCGGAAIHLDDIAVAATSTSLQTKVTMDMATKVENPVTLEEAYFNARGMSTLAGPLKSGVDDGTSTATGGLLTVLQANGSMNFALLVMPKGENSDWGADAQTHPSIEVTMNTINTMESEQIMGVLQAGGQVYTAFDRDVTGFGYVIGIVQAFPKG